MVEVQIIYIYQGMVIYCQHRPCRLVEIVQKCIRDSFLSSLVIFIRYFIYKLTQYAVGCSQTSSCYNTNLNSIQSLQYLTTIKNFTTSLQCYYLKLCLQPPILLLLLYTPCYYNLYYKLKLKSKSKRTTLYWVI